MNKVLLVLTLILLVGCGNKDQISIAGSSTVLPIVSKAAEMYQTHEDTKILVNAGGSGVGFNQVAKGVVDIGMMSRDIAKEEQNLYPELIPTTIGIDAVAVAISSEIYDEGIKELSFDQIRKIYSGEVRRWSEIGGPDREILVIDKEKSRGTRHVFMQAIFQNKNADAKGADIILGSNNEEQTAIAQSDAAIGMLSFAWLNDEVKGVAIKIDNNLIEPTVDNIKDYPIQRSLLLVTRGEPTGSVKAFIDYVNGPHGQAIVEESGYVSIE